MAEADARSDHAPRSARPRVVLMAVAVAAVVGAVVVARLVPAPGQVGTEVSESVQSD